MCCAVPLCLPGNQIQAKIIHSISGLKSGVFGIPSPGAALPTLACGDIGLAVVPGVCFGENGERLGRGGGYYDRFLAGFSGFSVGLCWTFAFQAEIPEQAHDARVRAVVTDGGIFRV